MKKTIISSVLAAAALSANAAPLVTVGDQLDLFFRGAVTGRWDSNITYTDASLKKYDDYSAVFRVGAEADYGRNSKFKANVKFFEDMTRYASRKEFNSNLSSVYANASYTEQALTIKGNFSFEQLKQNRADTTAANIAGQLVRYNAFNAGVLASYDFTDKIDGELGGNWTLNEYLGDWSNVYADVNTYAVPLSVYYKITEKFSAGLTYQYRYNEFNGGYEGYQEMYGNSRQDQFGGITIRGELLPKLTASAYAGITYRDPSGGNTLLYSSANEDSTTFAFNATLGYQLTEKVGLFAKGSRDFGNAATRQSQVNSTGEFGVNYYATEYVVSTASFVFQNSQYEQGSGRDDDTYIGRIGLTYIPNKFITLGTNYRYICNSSNVVYGSYNQHMVDITFSVKY